MPCEERLKELGFFLPGEEKAWEALITVFQYLKSRYKDDGGSLFTISYMEKTKGKGYKFHRERFYFNIRKQLFTVRTVIH